jgi:hypothetical protein
MTAPLSPQEFLARWQHADSSELANYQFFVADLYHLLGVPTPGPVREDTRDNAYVFERRDTIRHGDGSESAGRIDCDRRGHFVLEARKRTTKEIFDNFTTPDEYTFAKTIVSVRLAQHEGERLVSRLQAKRLTMQFERF